MVFENAIGIDVSKGTLDAHDYESGKTRKLANTSSGFEQLLNWTVRSKRVIFCFEHTGMYSLPLAIFLSEANLPFILVSGLEIKRSLGLTRGKSDKIDARHLARYAYRRRDEIIPTTLPSLPIQKLKSLLNLRAKMVKQRAGYKATVREWQQFARLAKKDVLVATSIKLIEELKKQIKKVEEEIQDIMKNDKELDRLFRLVTSVKGVGLVLGSSFLVYTNGFTAFVTWRKFASYSGIAPFEYQSGTSIKAPRRIHHFANKTLKTLLSNAATTSIQFNPEMKLYYQKRLQEGKSKMSTINIIRNKIVSRVFAVVRRGTPYVQTAAYV